MKATDLFKEFLNADTTTTEAPHTIENRIIDGQEVKVKVYKEDPAHTKRSKGKLSMKQKKPLRGEGGRRNGSVSVWKTTA